MSTLYIPSGFRTFRHRVYTGVLSDHNQVINLAAPATPQNHAREFAPIYGPANLREHRNLLLINGFESFDEAIAWRESMPTNKPELTTPWDILALSLACPDLDSELNVSDDMHIVATRSCPYTDKRPCTTRIWYRFEKDPSERRMALPYTDIIIGTAAWYAFAIQDE